MAPIVKKLLVAIPLLLFLVLSAVGVLRGRPGNWHQQCSKLWMDQKWQEIVSLASNLLRLDEADPEALYFAVLASEQLKDPEGTRRFGELLLKRRALNLRWEARFASLWIPDSLLERLATYRTRIVVSALAATSILCALGARWKRPAALLWSALISVIGSVLAIL